VDVLKKKPKNATVSEELNCLVNFGVGIFHFVVSLIPSNFMFIAKLLGFEADRERSLVELRAAQQKKNPKIIETTIVLAALKRFFTDEEAESEELLNRLYSMAPNSALINYLRGFVFRYSGKLDDAVQQFEHVLLHASSEEFAMLQNTGRYHLGYTYYLKQDFEKAIEHLSKFLDYDVKLTGKRFRPYCAFMLGFSYWKTNRRELVAPLYQRIPEWVRENQSYDKFALRKSQRFLESQKFSDFDELYLSAYALLEGKQYQVALTTIEKAIPLLKANLNNREWYAQFYFLKGCCLRGLKKYDRALQMFQHAIAQDEVIQEEKYVIPTSYVEMGEMALDQNDLKRASELLNKAREYKNYDWDTILNWRILGDLQKLNRRLQKQQQQQPQPQPQPQPQQQPEKDASLKV
jgi:tetratricopeptide (TPR) repeat protein